MMPPPAAATGSTTEPSPRATAVPAADRATPPPGQRRCRRSTASGSGGACFLDFLRLTGLYAQKDVEQAILRELEAFNLELGGDVAFVARQKRITVDIEHYHLDLLFYHRRFRRPVAVELKRGRFQVADKRQMEMSLRWLEKHNPRPGEEPPGPILCTDKSDDRVELLQLHQ